MSVPASGGSSPLTRGKRLALSKAPPITRLIPAHAGKTTERMERDQLAAAHPRSRGENPPLPHFSL